MKHFHRAHLAPLSMDSNAAQFARAGNPWDGPGQLKPKGGKRRKDYAGAVRRPERSSRDGEEAVLHYQCRAALAAKLGLNKRTIAPLEPQKSPTLAILPNSRRELPPLTQEQRALRDAQRAAVAARLEDGERAYQASEAAKMAEKRRLAAIVAAAEARLASL